MDKEEEQKNSTNQQNVTYFANLKKAFEENEVSNDLIDKFFSHYGKKAVFLRSIQNKADCKSFKKLLGKIKLFEENFEEISTISQIVLEFNQIFEPDAKRQKTAEPHNKDITETINDAIQYYVIKYFSSDGKELDLLQDKQRIKEVFKQDGNLIDEISAKIGKIGINYPDANDFRSETIVQKIFDLKDSGSTSKFSPIFFDLFENDRMEEDKSEAVCIAENYLLFAKSIKKYLKSARRNSTLKILQDIAQNSGNTTTKTKTNNNLQSESAFVDNEIEYEKLGSLRPDFRLQDEKGRVFQRVEVKRSYSDLHKAKAELTGKCYRLNKYQYGALKTQFALAIAGNTAVYYLIDFTLTCEKDCNMPNCNHPKSQRTGRNSLIELREYNLSYLRDRIALVFNSFVIAELCYQLESTFGVPSEFKSIDHGDTLPRTRNNGRTNYAKIDFHYQFNMVEKFVFEEDEISSTKLLESFYNLVQETQDTSKPAIVNIVKIEKFKVSRLSCKAHPFVIKLGIKPIGYLYEALISKLTSDIKQFEKAIIYVMEAALSMHVHGYVHRDIRWPNITYDPDKDTYLLFDFEQLGVHCDQHPSDKTHCCANHHERYYCTHAIFDVASIIKLFCLPKEFFFPDLIKYYKEYVVLANTDFKAIQNNNRTLKRLFWEFYEKNIGQVEGLDKTMVEKRVAERQKEAKF